jgi:hypothetical protein
MFLRQPKEPSHNITDEMPYTQIQKTSLPRDIRHDRDKMRNTLLKIV